ncbi:MAG: phytanoyl-CoA dioxygenase family protein [Xanthomonadales bacterium]|nr:phytanoyl-CoA dioxygenase family protein [Xanthomonadales bacterium]MCB1611446.1 phytanoyl-CoA dioxygenase family protein [Xanthomonadales bacterium]MCP5475598.1 phytanoyl-CoA dioxygenase family protein [Rhodanobacteraceae bacterium]
MRRVFNDASLQKTFDRKGYVQTPFLDARQVRSLKQAYFDTLGHSGGSLLAAEADFKSSSEITYEFTFIDRNPAYKRLVFDILTAALDGPQRQLLDDYRPIIANFIHKKPDGGEVPLHQNWAFVDERRCTSVSIWCPLVDSCEANGTLQFVEGSHKRFGEMRGPMVPWELSQIQREIIDEHLAPAQDIAAGQAVVLDDSIVHYSNINRTEGLRLAIQLILVPREEATIHFHMNPHENRNVVEKLEVDLEFFMNFHPWKKPEHFKHLATLPYQQNFLGVDEFKARLRQPPFDAPAGEPSR